MPWALVASWLVVGGSFLLTLGTGAQALAFRSEYRHLFGDLAAEKSQAIEALKYVEPALSSIMIIAGGDSDSLSIRASLRILAAFPIVVAIPLKIAAIRQVGGEEAVHLARLLREATAWSVLMMGSVLILAAVTVQLVLAYA
jgi:hypothetical protein